MEKIRKGDQVVVLSGRDKGRRGAVLRVLDGSRVLVESINRVKRHTEAESAGRTCRAASSRRKCRCRPRKVAIWNPAAKKADRVGIKTLADGKKVRFFKSNGEVIDA